MPATNLFTTAKTIAVSPKKAAKMGPQPVSLEGVEEYAQLKALMNAIEGLVKTAEAKVKDQIKDVALAYGKSEHKRIENFKAIEGSATVDCQVKKKGASALSEEAETECRKHQIDLEEVKEEQFFFNPDVLANPKFRDAISAAISTVPGLPSDVILRQAPTYKVSNEGIDKLFKLKPTVQAELFDAAVTLAVGKPTFTDMSMGDIMESVKKMIAPAEAE
jgi:hypothetical protein